jgi:hypothetical protein
MWECEGDAYLGSALCRNRGMAGKAQVEFLIAAGLIALIKCIVRREADISTPHARSHLSLATSIPIPFP